MSGHADPTATAESIPISLVAHWEFCPRRAWLEIHGERTDTAQMAIGIVDHEAVDDPATGRRARRRAVDVRSERMGVHGRCDSVEIGDGDALTVVEHKASPLRRSSIVTQPQRVQLALQAMCLEETGQVVEGGAVWFTTTKERVPVVIDEELRRHALAAVLGTREVRQANSPPPPLEEDDQCQRCSHVSVCLPDEHRGSAVARRIAVTDPAGRALHLSTPGSRAKLTRGQVEIRSRGVDPVKVPLEQTAGIVIHGNADVSAALIRETLMRGYPIVWCAWSGRVVGWATPAATPNGQCRARQFSLPESTRLAVARSIVAAKITNQRYVLRRHDLRFRPELRRLATATATSASTQTLFGLEGRAAALYFSALDGALKPDWLAVDGRHGRQAEDPFNAALNVAYGLLLADVLRAVVACGLEPAGGVLHSDGRNKPALALDLMEEFRPLVADAAVLWAFNNGELANDDFRDDFGVVRLTERGRKALIGAYERRAQSEAKHPVFGYRLSWRRAMEVQARMFLAVVMGERDAYLPVTLR